MSIPRKLKNRWKTGRQKNEWTDRQTVLSGIIWDTIFEYPVYWREISEMINFHLESPSVHIWSIYCTHMVDYMDYNGNPALLSTIMASDMC